MTTRIHHAPDWQVERWFNTDTPPTLRDLRGKVVVLASFQMLCPGCVSHGLPQASRVRATFSPRQVVVIGLHAVFEHHEAMAPPALQAFLHEYRIAFPVAVDKPAVRGAIPETMRAYAMQGTPTLTLIDAAGVVREQYFGQVEDLLLGAQIATLVGEAAALHASVHAQSPAMPPPDASEQARSREAERCADEACPAATHGDR